MMREGLVTIESNHQKYTFRIEKDLSEPCSHCGVPACGNEYFLFAGNGDGKPAIGFDGGLFGVICDDFISHYIQQMPYTGIALFLRQSNEHTGWNDLEDEVNINGEELLKALEHLSKASLSEWLMKDCKNYCKTLSDFTVAQMKAGRDLFLLKT